MKILHITLGIPKYRAGGLINYTYSVAKTESKIGHDVTILYPGHYDMLRRHTRINKIEQEEHFKVYELINPSFVAVPLGINNPDLFLQSVDSRIYAEFLQMVNPDLIHIHTFMGFHKELFEELKRFPAPVVFTTHDYYPVCPKTSRINEKNEICNNENAFNCAKCNAQARNSFLVQYTLQSRWYPLLKRTNLLTKLKKKRKVLMKETADEEIAVSSEAKEAVDAEIVDKYEELIQQFNRNLSCVDIFHCNSSVTEMIYRDMFADKKHFILNITSDGINDKRKETKVLPYHDKRIINIGFIGIRNYHKGYWILRDAGEILYSKGYRFQISFYGDEFNIDTRKYSFCMDMGMFPHNELSDVMKTLDVMVVPSYWFETFGFSTLEAVANGVPVLVSNHAGSKDILQNISMPHEFTPEPCELSELLEKYLSAPELLDQLQKEQQRLTPIFSMKEHVKQLLEEIDGLVH